MTENSSTFQNMNDRVIAESLRAGSPDALAACYDHCADDLFQYCWFMLRDREAARVALRDALVVAQAHIGRLKDAGLVRPWLYALARSERRRRRPARADNPEVVVARPGEPDTDLRLTAWNAVMALPAAHREALYLATKLDLPAASIGLVLGVSARDAGALLERGRRNLEHGVIGEVLARAGGGKCAGRAAILGNRGRALTTAVRDELAGHAAACPACSERVPLRVSAAKVFEVLPVPEPPPGMRLRTMTSLTDPELAGYRALVARRAGRFTGPGFPAPDRQTGRGSNRGTPRAGLWVALVSGAAAVMAGAVFALGSMGRFEAGAGAAQQGVPAVAAPGPAQEAPDASSGLIPGQPITPISPLGTVLRPSIMAARPGLQLFVLGRQSPSPTFSRTQSPATQSPTA
jgi:DNA-directed RNA polymerase specialized sigma24 family protein